MHVAPGIYALSQSKMRKGEERAISPAAVESPKGIYLIDVGFEGTTEQIEANLETMDAGWTDVRGVVTTHQDSDHVGALGAVVDRTDAIVYAHPKAAPYIDGREHPIKSHSGERYPPADVDVEIVDGVSFRTDAGPMEVCFTPGHAPGHCALYFPDHRLLIAADALTVGEDGLVGPKEHVTLDMDEAIESLANLNDREIDRVLCHHGGLVEQGSARIAEIVESYR